MRDRLFLMKGYDLRVAGIFSLLTFVAFYQEPFESNKPFCNWAQGLISTHIERGECSAIPLFPCLMKLIFSRPPLWTLTKVWLSSMMMNFMSLTSLRILSPASFFAMPDHLGPYICWVSLPLDIWRYRPNHSRFQAEYCGDDVCSLDIWVLMVITDFRAREKVWKLCLSWYQIW